MENCKNSEGVWSRFSDFGLCLEKKLNIITFPVQDHLLHSNLSTSVDIRTNTFLVN